MFGLLPPFDLSCGLCARLAKLVTRRGILREEARDACSVLLGEAAWCGVVWCSVVWVRRCAAWVCRVCSRAA